jgi:hypothetical protein
MHEWNFHVDNSKLVNKSCWDMILGCDLLEQLPPDVKFSNGMMTWQEVTIPVKFVEELDNKNVNEIVKQGCETGHLGEVTRRTVEIADASYEKANSRAIASECITQEERSALLESLLHCEDLFDGALGTWNGSETDLKLRKDGMPHFARPFPAPHS